MPTSEPPSTPSEADAPGDDVDRGDHADGGDAADGGGPAEGGGPTDHVDAIVGQWRRERPDLDTSALDVSARIVRLQRFLERRTAGVLDRFGVTEGEINVLAALRRSGDPYELTPTELYRSLLVSSGAMTNRLDRLVARGLVRRTPDVHDRRRIRVGLTEDGRRLVDEAMDVHTDDLAAQLGFLAPEERTRLVASLRHVLAHLEGRDDGG